MKRIQMYVGLSRIEYRAHRTTVGDRLLNMADNASTPSRVLHQTERKIHKNTHRLVKKPPKKREQGKNVIHVTANCQIKSVEQLCAKLVYDDVDEIIIFALGAAIKRGILLALQLCEKYYWFQVSPNTFSTELTTDLEPATDDLDYAIQQRLNSGLRIVLTRCS